MFGHCKIHPSEPNAFYSEGLVLCAFCNESTRLYSQKVGKAFESEPLFQAMSRVKAKTSHLQSVLRQTLKAKSAKFIPAQVMHRNFQQLARIKEQKVAQIQTRLKQVQHDVKERQFRKCKDFKIYYQVYEDAMYFLSQLNQTGKEHDFDLGTHILEVDTFNPVGVVAALKKVAYPQIQRLSYAEVNVKSLSLEVNQKQVDLPPVPTVRKKYKLHQPVHRELKSKSKLLISQPDSSHESRLHFISPGQGDLNVLNLAQQSWQSLSLAQTFPLFGRSVMIRDVVYHFGGKKPNGRKTADVVQIDTSQICVKPRVVAQLLQARSSFGCLYHDNFAYLIGGLVQGDQPTKQCERVDLRDLSVERMGRLNFASASCAVCLFRERSILKVGGVSHHQNSRFMSPIIEKYSIDSDTWVAVDLVLTVDPARVSLFNCYNCAVQINEHEVFVFGGYDSTGQGSSASMTLVVEGEVAQDYRICNINEKTLPVAEGFWESQVSIKDKRIYCLQNVDRESWHDQLSIDCMRRVLVFDGRGWDELTLK